MDEQKIFGIYSGNLTKNILGEIPTMSEEKTWKLIYFIESEIFWSNQENRNFDIDVKELIEKQYALEYLIYNTKRFGITFNQPCAEKHIEKSESYLMWYNSWNKKIFNKDEKTKIKR